MPLKALYILLGTFNGAKYIETQIKSIREQSITEWVLIVRDDGSTDDTVEIISRLQSEDRRIRLITDNKGRLGAAHNYGRLMTIAKDEGAETVFFSDQDDVWLPDKLPLQLKRLREMEKEYGFCTPILVHSDLTVVDESLRILNRSFMRYQGIADEGQAPLNTLLTQNYITGCAVAVNRPLLDLALPIPEAALMHDWWLSLCAAAFGKIGFIDNPTVLYRQHASNRVGAEEFWGKMNPFRAGLIRRWRFGEHSFLGSVDQAKQLTKRIANGNSTPHAEAVKLSKEYASCLSKNRVQRINLIRHLKIRRQGILRQIIFFLRLLLAKRTT